VAEIMLLSKFKREKDSFIDIVRKVKKGDNLLRNEFINSYKPFIIKSVSQVINKNIDIESSEEFSVGLMAFNESIECYNEEKKYSFMDFSKQVIKRRVIDYIRLSQKNANVYPFSSFDDSTNFEEKFLVDIHSNHVYEFELKEEFVYLEKSINSFGITIEQLINSSPKHRDTRANCIKISRLIAENENLYQKFCFKKTLPFTELKQKVNLSQRTLEKNRKFIIAMVLILKSNLDVLKKYIEDLLK
jgi:RNA polymerase sigma factor